MLLNLLSTKRWRALTIDAGTSIVNAGKLLNQYYEEHEINDLDREAWSQIIMSLINANRWLKEQFGVDCKSKQLKIDL